MSPQFKVGPYRVIRLINRGGQGSVYLGFDDRLYRQVAIKLLRLPTEKDMRREVLREARVVAELQSPKIVQIYDLIVARDHVAFIMEYVPGCDIYLFDSVRITTHLDTSITLYLQALLSILLSPSVNLC